MRAVAVVCAALATGNALGDVPRDEVSIATKATAFQVEIVVVEVKRDGTKRVRNNPQFQVDEGKPLTFSEGCTIAVPVNMDTAVVFVDLGLFVEVTARASDGNKVLVDAKIEHRAPPGVPGKVKARVTEKLASRREIELGAAAKFTLTKEHADSRHYQIEVTVRRVKDR